MITTRFAPSPTGHLHVGGIRTAIFNWAFARKHGGKFILRIDDTDQTRHVEGAIALIKEDFEWLGLDFDSEIYQSQRSELYIAATHKLHADGLAYEDSEGRVKFDVEAYAQRNDMVWRDKPKIWWDDLILGNTGLELPADFSIARSDETPLYNLATTVDDHELGVTHIIRGQEHISNTIPQLILADALYGSERMLAMEFAHIPFICAPNSQRKLSKRDEVQVTLDQYKYNGYSPEAIFNYLSHLGWAMDAETEIWSRQQFIKAFDFKGCNKKPAQFDLKKLYWLQGEYFKQLEFTGKVAAVKAVLPRYRDQWEEDSSDLTLTLDRILICAGDRLKMPIEIEQYEHFLNDELYNLPDEIKDEKITPHLELLYFYGKQLEGIEHWVSDNLERVARDYCSDCESAGMIKPFRSLVHALRAATTGQTIGFGVFEGLEILGQERTLKRIHKSIGEFNE